MIPTDATFLITGATGGIGQAVAIQLARRGHPLWLTGRRLDALHALEANLADPKGAVKCIELDVRSTADRENLVRLVTSAPPHERPSIWIHLAGINQVQWFEKMAVDDIEDIIDTNLTSTLVLAHQLLPLFKERPQSRILFVGSMLGHIGYPGYSLYGATKSALHAFVDAVSRETRGSRVTFHYIAPRAVDTQMNSAAVKEMNRTLGNAMDSPDAIAQSILKQLEQGKTRQLVGPAERFFSRVNALAPSLVDSALAKKASVMERFIGDRR